MHKGQITVLVLLIALMGLTIGLSQVSRSLSDLKQISYVDSGTKAFAAAESGSQYALNKILTGQIISDCTTQYSYPVTDWPGLDNVTFTSCTNSSGYVEIPLKKDEVLQLDLSGLPSNLQAVDIFWKNTNNNAAMEVITVDSNNVLTHYANNGYQMTPPLPNSFATAVAPSNCHINNDICDDANFSNGSCFSPTISRVDLIRIKPLYADVSLLVCGRGAGHSSARLDGQIYTITTTATTKDGVVKKLQIQKALPALPSIFDFSIYSGGGIFKN